MDIYCAALALVQGDEPEQYTSALAGAVRDNKYLPEYAECDFRAAPKVLAVAGSDLVILGSGTLVSQLTKERLIDEYQIVVVPVALGGGRTLFDGCKGRLSLKLKTSRAFANGNVVLCYEPQR
jgi:dihydrofolate reductase